MAWVVPSSVQGMLLEWDCLRWKSDKDLWGLIPYALCWTIWLERNNCVFNNVSFTPESVWDLCLARVAWWVKAWWRSCPYSIDQFVLGYEHVRMPTKVKVRLAQEWVPPEAGRVKFNVDGSSLGCPGVSGVGGILRNDKRKVLGCFSKATGNLWAYEAEVQAIYHALLFCQEFRISSVLVESDSSLVVGWVNRKEHRPWKLFHVLECIDRLVVEVNCVGIQHILREGNGMADCLAKRGRDRVIPLWACFA